MIESMPNSESHIKAFSFKSWHLCFDEVENKNFSPVIVRNKKGEILAPNGEVSQLPNELIVKITRTPAFKSWFGDWINDPKSSSKVIYSSGEPRIVYHRTDKNISIEEGLDEKYAKHGRLKTQAIYFKSVDDDKFYGDIRYELFVNIRTPVDKEGLIVDGFLDMNGSDYNFVRKKENIMQIPSSI